LGERSEAEKGEELARGGSEREREEAERGAAARSRRRERSRHTYCIEYYCYEEGGGSSRGASGVRKVVVTVEGMVHIKKDRAQGHYDGIDAYSRGWYKGAGEVAVLRGSSCRERPRDTRSVSSSVMPPSELKYSRPELCL
jgi:hypothetical protein